MDSSAPPGGGARDVYLPQREGPSRRGVWLALLALLIIAGYFLLSRLSGARNPSAQVSPAARPGVPVSAAEVKRGDLDRYLSAIGTVTAFNTVTVKTRVDGQIVNVAFKEGQTVHQGDLLVEIDPRPYQAALAQAEGQLDKDQAALPERWRPSTVRSIRLPERSS